MKNKYKYLTIVFLALIGSPNVALADDPSEEYSENRSDISEDVVEPVYIKADQAKKKATLKNRRDVMRAIKSSMSEGKLCVIVGKSYVSKDTVTFLRDLDYKVDRDFNDEQSEICWK